MIHYENSAKPSPELGTVDLPNSTGSVELDIRNKA